MTLFRVGQEHISAHALPILVQGVGSPLVVIPGLDGGFGMPTGLSRLISELEIVGLSSAARVWRIGRHPGLRIGTSISELADAYATLIRATFTGPVDVVGVSTGGSIALQLAADHPELVRRLVMVSSAHRLGDHGRETQRAVADLLARGHARRASALLLSNAAVTAPARVILAMIGWLASGLVVGRHSEDLRILLDAEDTFDVTDRLPSMRTPTMIVAGSHDRFYSRALYEEFAHSLPDASLRLRRSGHLTMHGDRRLARAVLAFFR
ncbi:MAG: alpha/beta hydrolase [Actinomycetota bacterium]|nr:alpha/beta hydrolase [Actinomycetota bacterium]